jgi:hypothetical protein
MTRDITKNYYKCSIGYSTAIVHSKDKVNRGWQIVTVKEFVGNLGAATVLISRTVLK